MPANPQQVPARRGPAGGSGNLPAELSSFVGRQRELTEAKLLLSASRVATLTGIGGVGKTRLALRVAAQVRRAFPDGVWFVDLTTMGDPELMANQVQGPQLLAHLVAGTLGMREQSARPPVQALAEYLAPRSLLLILDNCEHVLPACALLVDALLQGCPGMRVLVTSREPLGIAGEAIFAVPPLPLPDPGRRPALAELSGYESVALFVARGEAALFGFRLTEGNRDAVVGICHRLDGLPLAIELAAAWLRSLSPQQVLERLSDRFAVLLRGSRAAPDRQQTLRACVDWSFGLCTKEERRLWGRLSVFVGGFELDAVEGICAADDAPVEDLLDVVADLVDKSILLGADHGRAVRYRMLETIRDYGQEQLIVAGEHTVLRRRHRDWYQRLVEQASAEWVSDRQAYWLIRLGHEYPNLRAAVEFCLTEPGEVDGALRLSVALPGLYWWLRGLFSEGRRWLDRALVEATAPTTLRARALLLGSYFAVWQGDVHAGMRLLAEGHDLARRIDDRAALARAAFVGGLAASFRNDLPVAVQSLEQGLTVLSQAPDPELELRLDMLIALGVAAGMAGDQERANVCQEEMLRISEPRGETFYRSNVLWSRGLAAWCQGDLEEATAQVLASLRLKQTQGWDDRYGVALCLEVLAWTAACQQQPRRAATLVGAADALWADLGTPITSLQNFAGHHDGCQRQTRDALGEAAFQETVDIGRSLAYSDALAYALQEPHSAERPLSLPAPTELTRRERQIADLVAKGMSNKAIATALVISQRTAESHVEHIRVKLGFTSRAQIAAWAIAEQRAAEKP